MSGRQTAFGSYLTRFGIQYLILQHFTLLIILVCAVLKGAWQKDFIPNICTESPAPVVEEINYSK
jgi:hypothetical protein